MQAPIVISKKILTLVHILAKKKGNYGPGKSSDMSTGSS